MKNYGFSGYLVLIHNAVHMQLGGYDQWAVYVEHSQWLFQNEWLATKMTFFPSKKPFV